jgi:prevent-host-death family protein
MVDWTERSGTVDEMAISKFKATCLAVMERVRRTGKPVRITRFGKPVADVHPPAPAQPERDWIGSLAGQGRILGDLVEPVFDPDEWEALRD